jgi:prolyl-tRNA synthetase
MRWTQAFIPTLKEDPAEAEVASHKLMIRAGMLRKVAPGIHDYATNTSSLGYATKLMLRSTRFSNRR